jgi:hypothetical protein
MPNYEKALELINTKQEALRQAFETALNSPFPLPIAPQENSVVPWQPLLFTPTVPEKQDDSV